MEPCCQQASNLASEPTGREDLVLMRCQVCQRRHFGLTMDPGIIGVTGAPVGSTN